MTQDLRRACTTYRAFRQKGTASWAELKTRIALHDLGPGRAATLSREAVTICERPPNQETQHGQSVQLN